MYYVILEYGIISHFLTLVILYCCLLLPTSFYNYYVIATSIAWNDKQKVLNFALERMFYNSNPSNTIYIIAYVQFYFMSMLHNFL